MARPLHKKVPSSWKSATVLILCAIVLFWLAGPSDVPVYESRSLEYWLKELPLTMPVEVNGAPSYLEMNSMTVDTFTFGALDREETKHAVKAFRATGTNALPFLLRELQQSDGWGKPLARKVFKKLKRQTPRVFQPAKPRQYQAVTAMRLLGTNISIVRPQLEKLAKNGDGETRSAAVLLLQGISTNAPRRWSTPSLLAGIELE